MATRELPTGTVTLLFTDIEGSTRLLQDLGRDAYVRALTDHRRLLREVFAAHGGVEVEMQGDSFHFAFSSAHDAVGAAVAGQEALGAHAWEAEPIRVRMGLHTGEPTQADGLYAGLDVHHAARVMSAAHGGQVLLSERTAVLVGADRDSPVVLRDLGQHRLKDLSAPQRLYQASTSADFAAFPPLRTLHVTHLPVQANRLIGRSDALASLADQLEGDVRLLTLAGPGGAGKTRLALEVAAALVDAFEGGVYFVALASIRDPSLVLPEIAKSLHLIEESDRTPAETLAEHLAQRRTLIVLDNFEQIVEAAPALSSLLGDAPAVSLLITSREPLRVEGERTFAVAGLDNVDAVALFAERARAASSGFDVTDEDEARAVAAICARLDGLPLAIELAAARVAVLAPAAILSRLDRALALLTTGRRDSDTRHRTLRATIEWSHELLDPHERALFAGLSVFVGGCSLEAAEEVCGADLDALQSLIDKSLLRRSEGDGNEPRFGMLETIREYAIDCRAKDPGSADAGQNHAEYFARLAEEGEVELTGPRQDVWLPRLAVEMDNFRAAVAWALEHDRVLALRLASGLWRFCVMRSHFREGQGWLKAAIEARDVLPPDQRATALLRLSRLASIQGDLELMTRCSLEAIEHFRASDDGSGLAHALSNLAYIAMSTGDLARAAALLEESADAARAAGDRREFALALMNAADVELARADFTRAEELFSEGLAIAAELEDLDLVAFCTMNLGATALLDGRFDDAAPLLRRALEVAERVGDAHLTVLALVAMAVVVGERGELLAAVRLLAKGEAFGAEIGYVAGVTDGIVLEHARRLVADVDEIARGEALAQAEKMTLADLAADLGAVRIP